MCAIAEAWAIMSLVTAGWIAYACWRAPTIKDEDEAMRRNK